MEGRAIYDYLEMKIFDYYQSSNVSHLRWQLYQIVSPMWKNMQKNLKEHFYSNDKKVFTTNYWSGARKRIQDSLCLLSR